MTFCNKHVRPSGKSFLRTYLVSSTRCTTSPTPTEATRPEEVTTDVLEEAGAAKKGKADLKQKENVHDQNIRQTNQRGGSAEKRGILGSMETC